MSMKEVVDTLLLPPLFFKDFAILAAILTIVQVTPIKFNPWTWLKNFIALPKQLENLEHEFNDDRAFRWRSLIFNRSRTIEKSLKTGDLLRREEWEDTIETIGNYERYCEGHPEFKNELAVQTIEYIKNQYQFALEHNLFL